MLKRITDKTGARIARATAALHGRLRRPSASDTRTLLALAATVAGISALAVVLLMDSAHATPLTAGDRIQVVVEAGEEFSGKYQIDQNGRVQLPYAGAVMLAGLEPEAAAAAVADRLVSMGLFKRMFTRTSLLVLAWAPLDVRVSGAVFYAGAHRINLPPSRDRAPDRGEDLPGATLPERRLSDALRAAGGVTPWADVQHIAVRRQGQTRLFNLWGLLIGQTGDDPSLQSGDEILVPVLPEAQPALARPSIITPPGIKIFVSNLIQPSQSNAQATASNGQMSLAYGARFSQAVVAANCVGGINGTSADRTAVLVRTDRMQGTTQKWDNRVEALIRDGTHEGNPVLLEGDAVACYDSHSTSVRDVFKAIADVLLPFSLLRRLP